MGSRIASAAPGKGPRLLRALVALAPLFLLGAAPFLATDRDPPEGPRERFARIEAGMTELVVVCILEKAPGMGYDGDAYSHNLVRCWIFPDCSITVEFTPEGKVLTKHLSVRPAALSP